MTVTRTFSHLHEAIHELPRFDPVTGDSNHVRGELMNLWNNLEDETSEETALSKFDCNVCELSAEAQAFYATWLRA